MTMFTITFTLDPDDLDKETLEEYLKGAEDKDNPSDDELHDAIRDWIDDDINEVLGGELFHINVVKE